MKLTLSGYVRETVKLWLWSIIELLLFLLYLGSISDIFVAPTR